MFYTPTTLLQWSQDEDAAKAASTSHGLLDFPGILPNIRNAGKEIFKMTLGQKGNKKTHTHKNNQTNKPQKNLNKQKPKQKSKQKPKQEKNTKQDKKNPNKKNSHELASLTRPYTLKIYKHLIQTEIDYH